MALLLLLVAAVLAVVLASSLLLRWNELRYSRRQGLPPGTMGWPLFGETTDFLKQGPSFMKQRRLRYHNNPLSAAFCSPARRPVLCLLLQPRLPKRQEEQSSGTEELVRPCPAGLGHFALPTAVLLRRSMCLSVTGWINHSLERKYSCY